MYDTLSATVQTLNTALIAVVLASPSRLTQISSRAYIQTAMSGVPECFEMRRQKREKGSKSSRARAKMVRLPDWIPGIATMFITIKADKVKKMAGARPIALKKSWATWLFVRYRSARCRHRELQLTGCPLGLASKSRGSPMQSTSTRLKRNPITYVNVMALAIAFGTTREGSLASSAILSMIC